MLFDKETVKHSSSGFISLVGLKVTLFIIHISVAWDME